MLNAVNQGESHKKATEISVVQCTIIFINMHSKSLAYCINTTIQGSLFFNNSRDRLETT